MNPLFEVRPERAIADLKTLAGFGKLETGVNRRALTPEDLEARAWLLSRMGEAGLEAHIDGIGNVIGRTPGVDKYILIGSHTDTVPKGGWLDGAMGVIFGLELARAFVEAGPDAATGVQVMSFNDEEGRFSGLVGSRVFSGAYDYAEALALRAEDGVRLGDALEAAGYAGAPAARVEPGTHLAYLEAHIEQGPVLEDAGRRIGVVTDIVGVERAKVHFLGAADHAGTMPMRMRKDAAAALYDFAVQFARFCREECAPGTVWNLGHLKLDPGAYNVVTREAELGVEYRDSTRAVLEKIRAYLQSATPEIAAAHRVRGAVEVGVKTDPVVMDERVIGCIEAAAHMLEAPCMRMPSGAGHDAMVFTRLLPTGMLFVPSIGGRSHDLVEDTNEEDIALGLRVFGEAVSRLIRDGLGAGSPAA